MSLDAMLEFLNHAKVWCIMSEPKNAKVYIMLAEKALAASAKAPVEFGYSDRALRRAQVYASLAVAASNLPQVRIMLAPLPFRERLRLAWRILKEGE